MEKCSYKYNLPRIVPRSLDEADLAGISLIPDFRSLSESLKKFL